MNIFRKSNSEKLVQDIKSVVADAEAILHATADQAGGEVAELHASTKARLVNAKNRLIDVEEALVEKARQTARETGEYIHENPWQSGVIAGGVIFLIGYLISTRRH